MNIIKSIKISILKRRLVRVIGNYRFWSKKIRGWENRLTAYSITSSDIKMSDIEMCKLNGNIRYYTRKTTNWRFEFTEIKRRLQQLGVDVRVEL